MSHRWRTLRRGLLYMLLVGATLLALASLLWMTSSAFKPEGEIMSYLPCWIPPSPTLQNFRYILANFAFGRWWLNSIIAAVVSTSLVLVLDSLAAYAFARLEFRGSQLLYGVILSMLMVPIQVTIVPLYLLFSSVHLVDTLAAILLPTTGNVTGIFLLRQFFRSVPREFEEAARIDGASHLQIWRLIMLPLSRPALMSVAIITFISSWNNFLWPLVISYSDASRTLPVGIGQFFGGASGVSGSAPAFGPVMAAALLATLPAILVFLILQSYFVRGITMSGLKG
jgi:ABC-type glycerol-3-phosphate transport system permease component